MNRITRADRRTGLIASGVAVALCTLAGLAVLDRTRADYGPAESASERAEAGLEAAARPAHRLRASLAMPYFSFAHALRSRS